MPRSFTRPLTKPHPDSRHLENCNTCLPPILSERREFPDTIFTWVRLAQRIPVRIHIDEVPSGVVLSAGMTATVDIKDRTRVQGSVSAPRATIVPLLP